MPIFIRNYDWKQNAEKIHISVPLKDVQISKIHLFTDNKYIKLNSPPYIFELVLYAAIRSSKSKCIVKESEVILELIKNEPGMWTRLPANVEPKELVNVRMDIIEDGQKTAAREKEIKEKLKYEQIHFLRDCQFLISKEERQKIESLKYEQKQNAIRELVMWRTEQNVQSAKIRRTNKSNPVPVPFPRSNGVIFFSFTPRVLPTPKRQSKSAEEEEWLKKQAEAIRSSGFVAADLSEEQKDPMWLLNTGMNFIKNKNYLGALNAFEYAIKISPKMPILYVQLAETLSKLGRFPKAVDKATMALELLTPVVDQNRNLRAQALRIRAEAYASIGEKRRSAADYKESESTLTA